MDLRWLRTVIATVVVAGCSGQATPTAELTAAPTAEQTAVPTVPSPVVTATAGASATGGMSASSGAWRPSGSMVTPRGYHTATLLADGRVLVVGGVAFDETTGPEPTRLVEVYDPVTEQWTATGELPMPRWFHTTTRLDDGMVLVVGGAHSLIDSAATDRVDLFDPSTGIWSAAGALGTPRQGHTATLVAEGAVIVLGGNGSHGSAAPRTIERYDPQSRTWTVVGEVPIARSDHSATGLLDGSILVAGGFDDDLEALQTLVGGPRGDTWSSTDGLVAPRRGHTATRLVDGSVLVAGGTDAADSSVEAAERYTSGVGSWVTVNPMSVPRDDHAAALLRDSTVLVSGGRSTGEFRGPLSSAERFDPVAGDWIAAAAMSEARYVHTLTVLDDGSVLAAGGSGVEGMVAVSERFVTDP